MNVLITCAGKSERFKKKGIQTPKFLLSLNETTIISKILETYDDNDNFHLVITHSQLKKNKNLDIKIIENIDYYKLNETIKNNLYSLNDKIIIKNENQENHIILCDIKYNKEEIKKINLDNRVNYLVTKISQDFINQKKIMYKFINYE